MKRFAMALATLAALLWCAPAGAEFSAPPDKACGYLDGTGIHTRDYKNLEGLWGCSSPYFELGGQPLPNNVAYYVSGQAGRARRLKLVLNVNDRTEEISARQALAIYANVLLKNALEIRLPKKLASAIAAGKPASWEQGKVKVTLTRDDWPTGKGYTLKLVLD